MAKSETASSKSLKPIKPFSQCVSELTELWLEWVKEHKAAEDKSLEFSERRRAAEKCEILISRRYELSGYVNEHFKQFDGN